jgi:hypothetical protein
MHTTRAVNGVLLQGLAVSLLQFCVSAGTLLPECANYLKVKNFAGAQDLANKLKGKCPLNDAARSKYAPDPKSNIPGADTTDMACRYGNPNMWGHDNVCCGLRPHFNWILSTCEQGAHQAPGQFCRNMPSCLLDGSPKVNYVAAYQFNGEEFELVDESSVGEITPEGIAGNYASKTGFVANKSAFEWVGGDWTTKYAPWKHKDDAGTGPRGLTPPAAMWVLSAENFYYAGFYMLTQLGLNLEGQGNPIGTNCWNWELDPVEGSAGWAPGKEMPGNVNMLYSTNTAQNSGCMPVAYLAGQMQGNQKTFQYPEEFRAYCNANKNATGCHPWDEHISWSGGNSASQRFENFWDEPYVFAIVVDGNGYWNYRWRTSDTAKYKGKTGWPGVGRYKADRKLKPRPAPVTDPCGLKTDVPGLCDEAVMLQPSLSNENSCLRSSIEAPDWQFGSNALGAIAGQLGLNGTGQPYEGAQNWWAHFADTGQYQEYPMSIAGIDSKDVRTPTNCRVAKPDENLCKCEANLRDSALATFERPAKPEQEHEILV